MEKAEIIEYAYIRIFHDYEYGMLSFSGAICDYDDNIIIDFDSEGNLEKKLMDYTREKTTVI